MTPHPFHTRKETYYPFPPIPPLSNDIVSWMPLWQVIQWKELDVSTTTSKKFWRCFHNQRSGPHWILMVHPTHSSCFFLFPSLVLFLVLVFSLFSNHGTDHAWRHFNVNKCGQVMLFGLYFLFCSSITSAINGRELYFHWMFSFNCSQIDTFLASIGNFYCFTWTIWATYSSRELFFIE